MSLLVWVWVGGDYHDALVTHVESWYWMGRVWVGMLVLTIMFTLTCGSELDG